MRIFKQAEYVGKAVCILIFLFVASCASVQGDLYSIDGDSYLRKGKYSFAIEKYSLAIEEYERSTLADTRARSATVYGKRGAAYLFKGDYDQAIQDENKAIELDRNCGELYGFRGLAYLYKGDYDKAIQDLGKTIELIKKPAGAYRFRGMAFLYKGDYDRAIEDFNRAIELNPKFAYAYAYRGFAFLGKGKYDRAIEDSNRAIELDPKLAEAYANRGVAFFYKGEYDRAIEDSNRAIELNPKFAVAYNNRGAAFICKGDYDRAIKDFDKASGLCKSSSAEFGSSGVYYHKAFALFLIGDKKKAKEAFEEAYKADPKVLDKRFKILKVASRAVPEVREFYYKQFLVASSYIQTDPDKVKWVKNALASLTSGKKTAAKIQPENAQLAKRKTTTETLVATAPELTFRKYRKKNRDAIAIIIGNEYYANPDIPEVEFARRDAKAIKSFLVNALGYREGNIIYKINANKADFDRIFGTASDFKGQLYNWVKPHKSDVFIYYSGHGAPDPTTRKAYFVPVDCDPSYINLNGYPLDLFCRNLSKLKARSINVVIDACFSGITESGSILKDVSPVTITVKNPLLHLRNAVVFMSTASNQVATWYREKGYGLFTYYFLQALKGKADLNKDRKIQVSEIYQYLKENVPYMARRLRNREQVPMIGGGDLNRVLVAY